MDNKRIATFVLTSKDIERIKREGVERDAIRNETFCSILKNLGYRFYRDDCSGRITGVFNNETMDSAEFDSEDEYIDWLEEQRIALKPWVDTVSDGIIKSNRNVVFLVDSHNLQYKKLYSVSSAREWDKSFDSAFAVIKEVCEEHIEELEDGQILYIADRVSDGFKAKYKACYKEGVRDGVPFDISAVDEKEKLFFEYIVSYRS